MGRLQNHAERFMRFTCLKKINDPCLFNSLWQRLQDAMKFKDNKLKGVLEG